MITLRLFLVMVSLLSIRGEKDYSYRWQLAEAIVGVTDDEHEQDVMARLAYYEGGFRRAVARCEIKGDNGKSKGFGQVQPMSSADDKKACGPLPGQAELVLSYIRRSAEQCPKNEGAAKMNLYVSGRCFPNAKKGLREAQLRWGTE
jgi:hypothetical protein